MSIIDKVIEKYRIGGISGVLERVFGQLLLFTYGIISYRRLEEPCWTRPDTEELRKFKNLYKGKRCFIIGNGPSLNEHDLSLLENEYTFGVNSLFYKYESDGFLPSFYMVEDSHVIKDNYERIDSFHPKIHRFFPVDYKKFIKNREDTSFFKMNRGFYEKRSPNFHIPRFSKDFSKRGYCGQSVTIMNLQLAYYMGFSEVYLIGMDFSYDIPQSAIVSGNDIESTEDDVNHFHPDYFGKGKKWHDPQLEKVLMNYQNCKINFEIDGRKIYNATVGGKLELFERKEYKSLF